MMLETLHHKARSRFLDSRVWIAVTAAIGHSILGVAAWQGDRFALGMIIALLFFWSGLAVFNGWHWRNTLTSWTSTLESWQESNKLTQDFSSLLVECARALSTYDREHSDDIIERAKTIANLRAQNIEERSST